MDYKNILFFEGYHKPIIQKPFNINEGNIKGNRREITTPRPNVQPAPQKAPNVQPNNVKKD